MSEQTQERRTNPDTEKQWTGTASMYAATHGLSVSVEWMRGWNAHMTAQAGGSPKDVMEYAKAPGSVMPLT